MKELTQLKLLTESMKRIEEGDVLSFNSDKIKSSAMNLPNRIGPFTFDRHYSDYNYFWYRGKLEIQLDSGDRIELSELTVTKGDNGDLEYDFNVIPGHIDLTNDNNVRMNISKLLGGTVKIFSEPSTNDEDPGHLQAIKYTDK